MVYSGLIMIEVSKSQRYQSTEHTKSNSRIPGDRSSEFFQDEDDGKLL